MRYQVVAKRIEVREGSVPTGWEYYPYWAPGREKASAERLAEFAAQCGYEAAILQGHTVEMLEKIARQVVERQHDELVPALRYLPGAKAALAGGRAKHNVELVLCASLTLDPYVEGPDKSAMDKRRLELELGAGGDVTADSQGYRYLLALPRRMDVLSAWLRLYRRMVLRQVGGATDGAQASTASEHEAAS